MKPIAFPTSLLLTSVLLTTALPVEAKLPERRPFPSMALKRTTKGQDIITALGKNLPAVAAAYGKTEAEFRSWCLREASLRADPKGRLFYACPGLTMLGQTAPTTASAEISSATTATEQAFQLHSKPGASRVIYLDFTGHTTSGTNWKSGGTFVTPPYDVDGDATTFSATELGNIQNIWQRVSEDYAAFDVDVTTQEPGLESLRKTTSTDTTYGIRVCIGGSSTDWFGANAGGVAYLGSFSWNSDTPCYVFEAQLGNGNPKYVAEATSHEVGHTLSLRHDGRLDDPATTTTNEAKEYYEGHGNWAPIMGSGYYRDVVQFSKGDYALANNKEDDLTVIKNHVPLLPDEHGDGVTTATIVGGASLTGKGVINSAIEADMFGFTTGAGTIAVNAAPAAVSPNLDIALSLYDGAGNLMVSSTNPGSLGASLSLTVPAGTYYATVEGTGTGDAATAYTAYGSIGQFTLSGSVIPTGNQPPITVVSPSAPVTGIGPLTVAFSSAGTYDPDGAISAYDWDFGDQTGSTEANPTHTYSTPGTYHASLVVTDTGGLSSSGMVTVTVTGDNRIFVSNVVMSTTSTKGGTTARAAVTIKGIDGQVKSGATVTGVWSGVVTGTANATTGTNGTASLSSPRSKRSGTFTFTVTGVTLSGGTYAPSLNGPSSGSVTR